MSRAETKNAFTNTNMSSMFSAPRAHPRGARKRKKRGPPSTWPTKVRQRPQRSTRRCPRPRRSAPPRAVRGRCGSDCDGIIQLKTSLPVWRAVQLCGSLKCVGSNCVGEALAAECSSAVLDLLATTPCSAGTDAPAIHRHSTAPKRTLHEPCTPCTPDAVLASPAVACNEPSPAAAVPLLRQLSAPFAEHDYCATSGKKLPRLPSISLTAQCATPPAVWGGAVPSHCVTPVVRPDRSGHAWCPAFDDEDPAEVTPGGDDDSTTDVPPPVPSGAKRDPTSPPPVFQLAPPPCSAT